ncbi:uncharacterized protein MELLADRAFT_60539 [Melampsora larici-populina 98AG31]|uniref:Uncharacterized protein n=1 Tax=Melampsora larici-populina (strain 98AG31 / pathotype 3-4-7) TaxID=747676 RepID=F4RB46_MELLP|nr:uncharacterized protein MELLADRAFT_60539 [Melampsora larici-populina 98AG31]EGG10096.1 hypothetical protein MELLADRAFT_60539 [Melampsora larici-populina 98AG31]
MYAQAIAKLTVVDKRESIQGPFRLFESTEIEFEIYDIAESEGSKAFSGLNTMAKMKVVIQKHVYEYGPVTSQPIRTYLNQQLDNLFALGSFSASPKILYLWLVNHIQTTKDCGSDSHSPPIKMLKPNPHDLPEKTRYYLHDLDQVSKVVGVWLQSMPMTYPLQSALNTVWNVVEIELQAIAKDILPSDFISISIWDDSSYLNNQQGSYPGFNRAMDQNLDKIKNHNGKRERSPHDDARPIFNIHHCSTVLSTSVGKPMASTECVSNHLSQSAHHIEAKRHKTASIDEMILSGQNHQSLYTPDSGKNPPKSRTRPIPSDMDNIIQEIFRLDPLPSSIAVGIPSDYVATRIRYPCYFPSPDDYEVGELWEKIDSEFLNVVGADILSRGDLRRGKYGVLGIVDWILDAREHPGWDDTCENVVSGKLVELRDRLTSALLQPDHVSSHASILHSPTHSTTTLVGHDSPPTFMKDRDQPPFTKANTKSKWMDTVMVSDASSSDDTHGVGLPAQTIRPAIRKTGVIVGAIRMPRSASPPPDTDAEQVQYQSASKRASSIRQSTTPRIIGTIRMPRSETPPSDTDAEQVQYQSASKPASSIRHFTTPRVIGRIRMPRSETSPSNTEAQARFNLSPHLLNASKSKVVKAGSTDQLSIEGPDNSSHITQTVGPGEGNVDQITGDSPPTRDQSTRLQASGNSSSSSAAQEISSHQLIDSSQPQPIFISSFWVKQIDIYKSISVEKNNPQPTELSEIHKAKRVLLETLIRGSCTEFNPNESLSRPVTFSSLGQPGIRSWCEQPENRELFTPGLETIWYKPEVFNFDAIANSEPPESISRHERFLWNTLKNFRVPSATLVERGMHYVLAALVLIGSDAEQPHHSPELPDVSSISHGARTALSCWQHYKTLSSLRWAKLEAKRIEAADNCIEDLDKLIATIYTMVETFASIWAFTSLKADIEATQKVIRENQSPEKLEALTLGLEQLKNACNQIKVEYANLPALVAFLCCGVKGLMIYPNDIRVYTPLRAINILLVTSHLAQLDERISEPIWKRTQSYIVGFLNAIIQPTDSWVPQELNRYHLAKALFLDFSNHFISRNISEICVPKARAYKVHNKAYS